ncbi:hypothetical protein V2A60_001797 [Cordyceps javanica]|uniref:AAA family ATPase n=1 Tax=Cordyceps javanica TaxID=43265 RepID=A0A545VGA0_9HYPO|nr:AAA family ATPase [Cordyceps javanica]TQW11927.1 AAA family ATPase [Cordyceps javanica]
MVQKSITAKVRPLSHPSLEKKNLLGAARLYVSKDSLIALTNGLESKPCVVEKIFLDGESDASGTPIRREASLCVLPEKNLSPNVVMMTRAFQDATGFRVGDQVRIELQETIPDVEEVVLRDLSEAEVNVKPSMHPLDWRAELSISMNDAEQIYPGMVFEGVQASRLRRNFKVLRVNGQSDNIGRFCPATSNIRILKPGEEDAAAIAADAGAMAQKKLIVTGIPGLADQLRPLNHFLAAFGRPFRVPNESPSCAFVVQGGRGTGKTLILQHLAETGWGTAHWIRCTCKSTDIRETFKTATASGRPSIILLDELEDMLAKDRSNHDAVVEALGNELDALAARSRSQQRLPPVVVVGACLDFMTNVPAKLQQQTRFNRSMTLRVPRPPERREILDFLNPPLREAERDACLASIASQTHAYNGKDLVNLVETAASIANMRWDVEAEDAAQHSADDTEENSERVYYLEVSDMEQAFKETSATAMHDIDLNPPTVHWNDIGGQEDLKKVLSRMIKNAKATNPSNKRVLVSPHKGLLLYGPPGCSKTLSAQAMATESSFNFFAVKGAELLNMYVGESERAVRTLFKRARAASPAIIFFDEIDSIGGQRGGGDGGSRSNMSVNMLNALLTEMDGFESLRGVLVLAATNRPEAMDPALLRPGRFDQVVYVGPPNEAAREAVFNVHLRGLSLAPDVDMKALARLAEGYSGAEIKAICVEAGTAVLERHDDTDGEAPLEIAMADLEAAIYRTPRNITQFMTDSYKAWSQQFKKT